MVWQKLHDLIFIHIVFKLAKDISQPLKRIQLHDIAGLKQRVEYGIDLSPLVIMAEEIVLSAHNASHADSLTKVKLIPRVFFMRYVTKLIACYERITDVAVDVDM